MILDDTAKASLARIAPKAGGFTGLASLPVNTLNKLLVHPGEKVVIDKKRPILKLPNVKGGYSVYDKTMQFRYLVAYDANQQAFYDQYGLDVTVPEFPFGFDNLDYVWISSLDPGDYFYIMYTTVHPFTLKEKTVVAFVLVSPVDGEKILEPGVSPSPSALR